MQHLPVHWSEGLFLTAQHFQAADRHWSELLSRSEQFDQAYHYGLSAVRYSHEAIANGSFQLDACEGRTKRGTPISLGAGEEPARISLQDALDAAQPQRERLTLDVKALLAGGGAVRVYLAIPKLRLGTVNVGQRGSGGLHRYVELAGQSLCDESQGEDNQDVHFRTLNWKLLAKPPRSSAPEDATTGLRFDEDDPDYELLPIAQVRRAGESGPELDLSYIPPLLSSQAWEELSKGVLQRIYDWIGHRSEVLSNQVRIRRITLASPEPGDLDRLLLLMRLNEAYATLGHLAFARGIHPFVAYGLLVQIIGQLAIFDDERRPPPIPRYDHDELGPIFHWALAQIRRYLDRTAPQQSYFFRPFEGRKVGMQVTFDQPWLGAGFRWYVGVSYQQITPDQCRGLLAPNALFWKLASSRQVDRRFENKEPGLDLLFQPSPPSELPEQNWLYFEVTRKGDAWDDVVAQQTLAMRFSDKYVENRDALEGQRKLQIRTPTTKADLEFGLFAVASRT